MPTTREIANTMVSPCHPRFGWLILKDTSPSPKLPGSFTHSEKTHILCFCIIHQWGLNVDIGILGWYLPWTSDSIIPIIGANYDVLQSQKFAGTPKGSYRRWSWSKWLCLCFSHRPCRRIACPCNKNNNNTKHYQAMYTNSQMLIVIIIIVVIVKTIMKIATIFSTAILKVTVIVSMTQ